VADLQGNLAGAREARLADRVAAVTLATAAPPFPLSSRAADATPPNGVAVEDLSIGYRVLHQRREGRANLAVTGRSEALRNHWPTLTHPLESLSFVRRLCNVAAEIPEATGSGFRWKSATTEFTNPPLCLIS
jgi:hypothetical protein